MAKKSKTDKAAAYAYRLFSVRPRSEKELKDRLFGKGFGGATACEVISILKEKNIIDDLKFARLWVESRMRRNPKGDMALQRELRQKGISAAVIEKVLSERQENEGALCRELAEKKAAELGKLPREKARRKLFDFLARRGFNYDIIEGVIREALGAR